MSLYVVATPIGHEQDISLRAIETLKNCDVIVGEEFKEVSKLLKRHGVLDKRIELLNEHSRPQDVQNLLSLCKTNTVALVSDCGTPGFCDPGAQLVAACRQCNVEVKSIPGPASLMAFLSVCGQDLKQFHFRGFIPANREQRNLEWQALAKSQIPIILMDTPYRLTRLLEEAQEYIPQKKLVIGLDLSSEHESVLTGTPAELIRELKDKKAEFILLALPTAYAKSQDKNSGQKPY